MNDAKTMLSEIHELKELEKSIQVGLNNGIINSVDARIEKEMIKSKLFELKKQLINQHHVTQKENREEYDSNSRKVYIQPTWRMEQRYMQKQKIYFMISY